MPRMPDVDPIPWRLRLPLIRLASTFVATALAIACVAAPGTSANRAPTPVAQGSAAEDTSAALRPPRLKLLQPRHDPVLDDLQARTFRFFWERTNPSNGLVPDRWPTPSFASVAAVGFGLTAYPIGVQRGLVTREQAAERVLATLRFLWSAPQGPEARGMTGYHGFFYHFLDMTTGARWGSDVELSSIDTALAIAGVLTCQAYFTGSDPVETEIRSLADAIYRRVEWDWMQPRPPLVSMGWTPEAGLHDHDYRGYDEAMILYLLALGSPTHPIAPEAWTAWTSTYRWANVGGQEYVNFAPLFGHQFTHIWVDFRGIRDAYMRDRGIDYFENSRRAVLAQRAYAIANPMGWAGYGPEAWGLSACDGPADATLEVNGQPRRFHTYAARGVSADWTNDDGTIAPMAAASSVVFAPEVAIPAVHAMRARWGAWLWAEYGFLDAFNPSFTWADKARMGRVVPGEGWFDGDYLGIDQGPIVAMIENYRDGFVWGLMRKNASIVNGLRRAGFTGGWLAGAPD